VSALALGLRLAQDQLRVIHAGDPDEPALRDYLALGATRIEVLPVRDGSERARVLACCLESVDIILTGRRAEGPGSDGLLPYALAHELCLPMAGDILDAEVEHDRLVVRQLLPRGGRRRLALPIRSVLAVHPMAPKGLGYAYARRIAGKIETIVPAAGPGIEARPAGPAPLLGRAGRLSAPDTRSAHERMMAAVAPRLEGGAVVSNGSPLDKAQVILTYLRDNRLVDF